MSDIYTAPFQVYSATPGVGDWKIRFVLSGLDAGAAILTVRATVGGSQVNGGSASASNDATITTASIVVPILAAAGEAVVITVQSNLAADSAGVTLVSATATQSVRQTGDSYAITNSGTYGNAQLVRSTTPANTFSVDTDGRVDVGSINGSTLAARILAAEKYSYKDDAVVLVADGATDAARGTNLATAYTSACSLTPGGNALSAANRAAVLMPEARYDVASNTLVADTDYVDLIALVPERGGLPLATDVDSLTTSLGQYRPSHTEVYSETAETTVLEQSASNVRMRGFSVGQLAVNIVGSYDALGITADDNIGSVYDDMYFWHKAPVHASGVARRPVGFAKHVYGLWRNCAANSYSWRIGHDVAKEAVFSATMYDCIAGPNSFIGDHYGELGVQTATNCWCERCKCVGYRGFAGCSSFGLPIAGTCTFIDCESGDNSYGLGEINAGLFIRCRGEDTSFGATTSDSHVGEFSGIAIDCYGGAGSFGGHGAAAGVNGKLTGKIVRCVSTGSVLPLRVEGATIEDCLLETGTADQDCITLLDSTSRIHNSTILVAEGGTGVPINAGSALSVAASGNRYNNTDTTASGLGANVTNLGTMDRLAEYSNATNYTGAFTAAVLANAPHHSIIPLSSTVSAGAVSSHKLESYQDHKLGSFVFTVLDSTGGAVNLNGKVVHFGVAEIGKTGAPDWSYSSTGSEVVISTTDYNVVTVAADDTHTGTPGLYQYRLSNYTDDAMLDTGTLKIVSGIAST